MSGFPHSSVSKESTCNAGDLSSIPGSGRCPVEGNDNPLQYFYLENLMDSGAWQATVLRVARVGHDWSTNHCHIVTRHNHFLCVYLHVFSSYWKMAFLCLCKSTWWLSSKEPACQCMRRRFDPWVRKIPWRKIWQATPVFSPGNPMNRGAWWTTVHGVANSQTQLSK